MNTILNTTSALWDEIYSLRRMLIRKHECPSCGEYVLEIEMNGVPGFYECLVCRKIWTYFGGLEADPKAEE